MVQWRCYNVIVPLNKREKTLADEKTVVVNSQPETIVEPVAEEKELPPIVWNENNTLYIYKGQPKCAENGYEVIQVTATLIGFDNREIKINVSYCRNCDRFFISYTTYELYHSMTPQKYIDELQGAEKFIFSKLYAGNTSKKLYRLYEYKK